MVALSLSVRRICLIALLLALYVLFALVGKAKGQVIAPATQAQTKAQVKGQAAASAAAAGTTAAAANATSATAVWTVKMSGDIRWQQITPAGALLVATDGSLAGVDIDRGTVAWEKPELGGIAADSLRPMEDSLLMIAERPGLLMIFDPVTGAVRGSATLPTQRGMVARYVRLYGSVDKADRIYVSFDDSLMAYKLADGQALWAKPAKVEGRIRDIVQHPNGIVMLPDAPPQGEGMSNVRIVNGVVQTGINVARYEDGTTIAEKPVRMHGSVIDAMIAGNSVVLAVDAESKTFVNVLDVSSASLRLKKDAKIKGQLAYAELTPT